MSEPHNQNHYRWTILSARNKAPEQPFFYAVITTGIVCRPGCPSRLPKPENVRFFDSCEAAVQAGYRPCKRCQPLAVHTADAERVVNVCRWIEEHPDQSDLASLAATMNCTSAHLQKTFRKAVGISPFDYARALRQQRILPALKTTPSATHAMAEAGYQSSSQFYAEFQQFSCLPPGSHGQSGQGEVLTFAVADTALGALVVAGSDKGVCWISLGDDAEEQVEKLQKHFARATFCPPDEAFNQWVSQVVGLVHNPSRSLSLPLDIRGTVFQQQVWKALREIPPGTTLDYQSLAEKVGKPGGARAVASACGANVLALAIPCHRIVRRDGSLSGYRWGVARKAALLEQELTDPHRDQSG